MFICKLMYRENQVKMILSACYVICTILVFKKKKTKGKFFFHTEVFKNFSRLVGMPSGDVSLAKFVHPDLAASAEKVK